MKFSKAILSIILSLIISVSVPFTVHAAQAGTTSSNAINIVFGSEYSRGWTKDNDHLYCYNRISVPSNGVLTMNFLKPTDSEGEIGKLDLVLYDEYYDTVWDSICYYSVQSPNPYYVFNVGLPAGDYYLLVRPKFSVTSGTIYTDYSFSFSAGKSELEPNNSQLTATKMSTDGTFYKGYYGKDGGSADSNDYFRFDTEVGRKYSISFKNIDKFISNTMILKLENGLGGSKSIKKEFTKTDDFGNPCYEFIADSTSYTLGLTNYSHEQIAYAVAVNAFDSVSVDYNINEPNESKSTAINCPIGTKVNGEIGSYDKYRRDGLDTDWYKFSLTAGNKYRIYVEGYNENFASTTLIIDLYYPDGNTKSIRYDMRDSGNNYIDIAPTKSGTHYLRFYNYFDNDKKVSHPYSVTVKKTASCQHKNTTVTLTKKPTSTSTGTLTTTCKLCNNKTTKTVAKLNNTSITKITAKSKGFTVYWKKVSTTGYQIQYSTSSKFTNPKTVTVSSSSTISKSITKLTAKKKYYVRVRTYKTVNGTKCYSKWSASKYVTTKR